MKYCNKDRPKPWRTYFKSCNSMSDVKGLIWHHHSGFAYSSTLLSWFHFLSIILLGIYPKALASPTSQGLHNNTGSLSQLHTMAYEGFQENIPLPLFWPPQLSLTTEEHSTAHLLYILHKSKQGRCQALGIQSTFYFTPEIFRLEYLHTCESKRRVF